ncbi:mercuric ion transport protein [Pycnococcus provasolii]
MATHAYANAVMVMHKSAHLPRDSRFVTSHKAYVLSRSEFFLKYLACLATLSAALAAAHAHDETRNMLEDALAHVQLKMLDGARALALWTVISMLASACCALQILLACLSLGCAGLNTVLGPVRPMSLAVATVAVFASWYVMLTRAPWQLPSVVANTAFTAAVTLLPEIVEWRTTSRRRSVDLNTASVVKVRVGGIGCTACAAAASSAAEAVVGVSSFLVDVDTGVATVTLVRDADKDATINAMSRALQSAGYSADVEFDVDGKAKGVTTAETKAPQSPSAFNAPGALLGGLLGSSCCIVQLGINAMSAAGISLGIGCAGFNKYLGPSRPFWRVVTLVYVTSFVYIRARRMGRRALAFTVATVFLTALLTFLPELLLRFTGTSVAPDAIGAVTVDLRVDGMGCEACQTHVQSVLAAAPGVVSATAKWTEGTAKLLVNDKWGFDLTTLRRQLADDGYEVLL